MPNFSYEFFLSNLVQALLSGPWTPRSLLGRAKQTCHGSHRWLNKLVRQIHAVFGRQSPSHETLLAYLQHDFHLQQAWQSKLPSLHRIFWLQPTMAPRNATAESWQVPALVTAGQLADWLGIPLNKLDWLADTRGLNSKQPLSKLRHYLYRWIPRRRGQARLLEIPKPQLKAIQRRILHEILDKIPPHEAAHGFRTQRSIVSYAQPHAGRRIVLRFDLRDFFASVWGTRVEAIFRIAGYPQQVARLLMGLCTTRTPTDIGGVIEDRWRSRHLPQGAPTSPALANLAAYRLDVRLLALAQSLGATYTRYADDLAFSGDQRLVRAARRMLVLVAVIAAEEGFSLNFRKCRFMRQSLRQQLAGVVVNVRPNVCREVYDELKATLFNCGRHGPESQNRSGQADFRRHLLGRIAHVKMLNPQRGAKLQLLFDRIVWPMEETQPPTRLTL